MYKWFKIFNKTEFVATGLVSRKYTFNLEGIGQKDILATTGGENIGITYNGKFLIVGLNGNNPYSFEGHAVYLDANNDVFLGIAI